MSESIKRKVTESQKKTVAGKQNFKCKGNVDDYECPLYFNKRDGMFDEAGYEIDHINELSKSNNNDIDNLQALCPMCHRVKTKRFNQIKKKSVEPKTPSKPISNFNIELKLFNNKIVMGKKLNSKQFDKDTYIDNDKKVYQINKYSQYRIIGTFDKNKYNHIFNIIKAPPTRTRWHSPYNLIEETDIIEWVSTYGYSYDEYQQYKSI